MERRVTSLELFFDLVFVFAFTQVTGLLSDEATWEGLAHALMILALLWWSWGCYAWLTNTVDPEEEDGPVRLAIFGAMGAMLIVALTVPGAFAGDAVTFGVAYFLVRALHPVLYLLVSREDSELRGAVMRFAPPMLVAPALVLAAGFFSGEVQAALWVLALLVDYVGLLVAGVTGWRVDATHFAERFALIIIIALGESIVAIGVGAADLDVDGGVILASVFALVVAAALWWSYFDVAALVAVRRLEEAEPRERALMARDSFTYLHLPMVAGIILFALGVKKTLEHTGDGLATITVVRPELPFGVARLDGAGRVEGFVEKPRFDGWINGGFFCFERGVLDYLGEDSVLEGEPFERLAADGQLRAYRHTGFWDCLDTYKDAVLLNDLWTAGRAPWKLWR